MCADNVFGIPASLELMPPIEGPEGDELLALSHRLTVEAAKLSMPKQITEAVGDLVRGMNCYYSNLIEGHPTTPVAIADALKKKYDTEPKRRDLQLEAEAHIKVQEAIDAGELDELGVGAALTKEIHRRFYEKVPPSLRLITDKNTGKEYEIIPGEYRRDDVEVGQHLAVTHTSVPGFMDHWARGYGFDRTPIHLRGIAAAASHHRFLWIHPFLDGNGRVARLHSYAYLRQADIGSESWSVARGLAIWEAQYKGALQRADYPPQRMTDGRGTLSTNGLVTFVKFFLETCLDQVLFMRELLEPEKIEDRLTKLVRSDENLSERLELMMTALAMRGEISKARAIQLLGVSDRSSRRLWKPLIERGILRSDTGPGGTLRLAFPLDEAQNIFPTLFQPREFMEMRLRG